MNSLRTVIETNVIAYNSPFPLKKERLMNLLMILI
jgi:hypothetical protein